MSHRPAVTQYLDFKKYLTDYYLYRKSQTKSFSYATWAEEMGIQSRSFLRLVLIGKRSLTERLLPTFTQALGLNDTDSKYFSSLVSFNQAPNFETREHHRKELSEYRCRQNTRTQVDQLFAFLSSPLTSRIEVLLEMDGVDRTIPGISKSLKASITETRKHIDVLLSIGLIESFTLNGYVQYRATGNGFEVPDTLGSHAIQTFHRNSLAEAQKAIDLPPSSRHFEALALILSEEDYGDLVAEMKTFFTSVLNRYPKRRGQNFKRLYQANFNLIPVSDPILHSEKIQSAPMGAPPLVNQRTKP